MKIILLTVILLVTNCQTANTQNNSVEKTGELNSPKTLEIFEPNVISNFNRWTFTPTFSKNMQTLVFVGWENPDLSVNQTTIQKLYKSKKVNGKWTEPIEIKETKDFRVDLAHFSPDGKWFLVSYTKPHAGHYKFPQEKGFDDFDIWIAPANEKGEIDWENFKPIKGADINRAKTPENRSIGYVHNETGPRMDLQGNLYFWTERLDDSGGRRDIYMASVNDLEKGEWETAKFLPSPINSAYKESGGVTSLDGKWMIFASERPGGSGGEDLYFSKRLDEEKWSEPINLGEKINSSGDEGSPQFSPDGKALFFSSNRLVKNQKAMSDNAGNSSIWVIYWISTESLKLPIN
jgi:Tol biopolymer transport system component